MSNIVTRNWRDLIRPRGIHVDQESLTKEVRKRHEDVRDQMKTKWLEGLSEEGRAKLTEREKEVLDCLENAVDHCEKVADLLVNLAVKNG